MSEINEYILGNYKGDGEIMIEKLIDDYLKLFGEPPFLPQMASYEMFSDLIKEAIIRKEPLTPDEIMEELENNADSLDLK